MQIVNRTEFISYINGTLLQFKKGGGTAVNETECDAAMAALERGETIALTVSGKIVSYIEPSADEYTEVEAKGEIDA